MTRTISVEIGPLSHPQWPVAIRRLPPAPVMVLSEPQDQALTQTAATHRKAACTALMGGWPFMPDAVFCPPLPALRRPRPDGKVLGIL